MDDSFDKLFDESTRDPFHDERMEAKLKAVQVGGVKKMKPKNSKHEKSRSRAVQHNVQDQSNAIVSNSLLLMNGLSITPRAFGWMDKSLSSLNQSDYAGILGKEMMVKPKFITIKDKKDRIIGIVQLYETKEGKYRINTAQCVFSHVGIKGFLEFLEKFHEYNIDKDCQNFIKLVEFFYKIATQKAGFTQFDVYT